MSIGVSIMDREPGKSCRWPKWALFIAFVAVVPVPYYMFVVGGQVPLSFILLLAVRGTVVALPKFTAEGFWMLGVLWAHVAVLGGVLYIAAIGVHRLLFRFLPRRVSKFVVIASIAGLFVLASTKEIYRLPGHNYAPPANLYRLVKSFAA
jgi:hypothetical protein